MHLLYVLWMLPFITTSTRLRQTSTIHTAPTTTNNPMTSKLLGSSAVILQQKALEDQVQKTKMMEQNMNQVTQQAEEAHSELAASHALETEHLRQTQEQLAQAMIASVKNFTNTTSTDLTTNSTYLMMKDGVQSKQMMEDMPETPPTRKHWDVIPDAWEDALKQAHYDSLGATGEQQGSNVAFDDSLQNYTFGQSLVAKSLSNMATADQITSINNAGGYVRTKDKTKDMEKDVNASTIDRYESAIRNMIDTSKPPEIVGADGNDVLTLE